MRKRVYLQSYMEYMEVKNTIAVVKEGDLLCDNGAGKTTLVKLLCRLYDPTSGSISVGGNDIKKLNYRDYRGGIA